MSGPGSSRTAPVEPPLDDGSAGCVPARRWAVSAAVGLAALAFMLATEPRLAIVWDEGYTLGREARIRTWLRALRDPQAFASSWTPPAVELVQQEGAQAPRPDQVDTRAKLLFDPQVVAYFWPFAREEPHGHPPFYALLGLIGDVLAPTRQTLPRARLGPILLFSLCAGVVFAFVSRRWGAWPAVVAASAWVLQPNLFGNGHYAAYDAVLSSLWLLGVVAFVAAVDGDRPNWLATFAFGAILGCAMATKLTGWFLPFPFAVWAILYRSRRAAWVLGVGLALGVIVLFLCNPPWWTDPISGLARFFQSNLTRGKTRMIPVEFLGTVYKTPVESLPWYNTIVWTVLVTPVGFLLLGVLGIYRAVARARADRVGLLILGHWLLLMALRAAPHTPGHDGVRLFLPAFGLLALLAGLGAEQLGGWMGKGVRWLASASLAEGLVSVLVMMPTPLSYFSPVIGGLPGAARLGMEPTYYWDALGAEALAWLRDNTGPGQTIQFASGDKTWLYLRETGSLPRRLARLDPGIPTWYVLQNRPGAWHSWDQTLVERATPAFIVEKLGVPLVWIFPYRALQEAAQNQGR